jgi:adenine deaminase
VVQTYINGQLVAENGQSLIERTDPGNAINNFSCNKKSPEDFAMQRLLAEKSSRPNQVHESNRHKLDIPVIEALDGQLITNKVLAEIEEDEGILQTNIEDDILKIVVVNRYKDAPVAKAFIKNFGLKKGAIASSVAHDSHNIVAVGVNDESLCNAINLLIEQEGGVSCIGGEKDVVLPLPVAGLMSAEDGYEVARRYSEIDRAAKDLGSTLSAPFMTLSFMALLVIPHLKLSDLGLFDGDSFQFIAAEINN